MSLTRKAAAMFGETFEKEPLPGGELTMNKEDEWAKSEAVSGVRPITPEQLYDLVSKTYTNVAIVNMGGTWVFGRMLPLSEIGEDGKVRRLGATYGIEVIVESTDWSRLVARVLKTRGKETL